MAGYTYTLTHNQVSIDVSKPIQEADRPLRLSRITLALISLHPGLNME